MRYLPKISAINSSNMGKKRELSMDIKNLIIDQHKNGKSLRFINKLLNLQHSIVQQVV